MGDADRATGMALRFLRFAQIKHKAGKYITEKEFQNLGFDAALFPAFATLRDDGLIECVGAEKLFGWLRSRVENGKKGGKASAAARTSHSNNLGPSEPKANTPEPEPSPSPSPSSSVEEGVPSSSTVVEKPRPPRPKISSELFDPKTPEDFMGKIPESTLERWAELYPDEIFVRRETLKALSWTESNPKRRPRNVRGWTQFLSNWFDRGWSNFRKTIPVNR